MCLDSGFPRVPLAARKGTGVGTGSPVRGQLQWSGQEVVAAGLGGMEKWADHRLWWQSWPSS